jgi:competence protein ComGC
MSEIISPETRVTPQPKTSGLAIWSLVLGILSLACFSIFTAIPGVICGHKSLSGQGLAIAGLVTGYLGIALAILIIPLMIAIAIPNFVKARSVAQTNACINNLRQIDAAKMQWALENSKTNGAIPAAVDLSPYLKGGLKSLQCPAGGTYTIGPVGEEPTCSIPDHKLLN